jgi:carboxymethylenebutenolidase
MIMPLILNRRLVRLLGLSVWLSVGLSLGCGAPVLGQQPSCHGEAGSFSAFADKAAFRARHPAPAPLQQELAGEMVSLSVSGGDTARGYVVPARSSSNNVLLVFHEWWGLNAHIKHKADELHGSLDGKVHVIAPDLYDGKVADKAGTARNYMQAAENSRLRTIVRAAQNYARTHTPGEPQVGAIGWCFGGGWALKAALMARDNAVACVMYYGMPVQDVDRLRALRTDVLGIFGSRDQWITPEVVEQFRNDMSAAGKELIVHTYDAPHAFANPSRPGHAPKAAEDARETSRAYLRGKFRLGQ